MGKKQSKEEQDDAVTIDNLSKKLNLENLTLIWCDSSKNDSNQLCERQLLETTLRRAINFLRRFTHVDECRAFIREVEKEKVRSD